ncbi:hypothetical protein ABXZ88_000977 [Vibrio fluvialis]|uniref:hypothetical protein n=1 Tax=Vibrio cholerae TaxID=666 RepID=UPI001560D3C3|nr:hypothetical protein [Vibrio cholerae]NOF86776.1 hypothetical protein [Vibrio cholerae]NOF96636.1 hypothetical protein [Vibrio cholerae]
MNKNTISACDTINTAKTTNLPTDLLSVGVSQAVSQSVSLDTNHLRHQFVSMIAEKGGDSSRGNQFDTYLKAFQSTPPPASVKGLQKMVRGEYKRAKLAFDLLSQAFAPNNKQQREKPLWFNEHESKLANVLQNAMTSIWQKVDFEIQALAEYRAKEAENRVELLNKEIMEYLDLLDEKEMAVEKLQAEIDSVVQLRIELAKQQAIDEQREASLQQFKQDIAQLKQRELEFIKDSVRVPELERLLKAKEEQYEEMKARFDQMRDYYTKHSSTNNRQLEPVNEE